jgi:ABC-type branched-subunit amino acid transport system substrate-binding protein
MHRNLKIGAVVVGAVLTVSACGTKGGGTSSGDSGGVKTDAGVTAGTINLGVLTDNSGPYKNSGVAASDANQMWADEVNASGGICGRQVKLTVRDAGFSADKAVTLYSGMKNDTAALLQVLGSAPLAAIKAQLVADSMLAITNGYASTNLDKPEVVTIGATYDVIAINALAYMQKAGKIKDGDKVGMIYLGGEAGDNVLLGAKYYAEKHSMTLIPVKVSTGDSDMAPAITSLKSNGVKSVLLGTVPAQTGSAVVQAASQGLNVPIFGMNASYDPNLLGTPAKDQLAAGFQRMAVMSQFDSPDAAKVAANFQAKYKEPISESVLLGYTEGVVMKAILQKACDNKDLTRAGIVKAKGQVKIDKGGILPALDFTTDGSPSARQTMVVKVDPSTVGTLAKVDDFWSSPEAEAYKAPAQK